MSLVFVFALFIGTVMGAQKRNVSVLYQGGKGSPGLSPATSMKVHYYFIESEQREGKEKSPLVLWSNGGPGASSLFGIFTELGPFSVSDYSLHTPAYNTTGVPTLFYNDYSWSQFSNVLMFDWPPPTGFSYCDDDASGDGMSCGPWDDTRQSQISFAALSGFFDKFPELVGKDFYLTGESYAGVYVPKLAQEIFSAGKVEEWALKGVAVGDACMGTEVLCGGDSGLGPYWNLIFLYGHGQFSTTLWNELLAKCGLPNLQYTAEPAVDATACSDALARVGVEVGGYYAYNLYDTCTYDNAFRRRLSAQNDGRHASTWKNDATQIVGGSLNDYPCGGGNVLTEYMELTSVRKAMHVPLTSNFFSGDNAEGMVYELTEKNLMPFFEHLARETDLTAMVYNGDTDPSINSFAAQNWTSALGLEEAVAWRPWTTDGCQNMAGYTTHYRGDLQYTTIRGSGHMVPTYKPEAAATLMRAWLVGADLPEFDASCSAPPG